MEDKDLEKPEAAEETAVQPENGRALKEEPEKEKKVLTPEEMEKRRKFIVIPAFVLVFLGVMYWIFAPSGKENETEAPGNSGFNVNVPEPTTAKLVDKKTAAYEKQQAEVEEESRMKSLEQLAGTLMNEFLLPYINWDVDICCKSCFPGPIWQKGPIEVKLPIIPLSISVYLFTEV